MFNKDKKAGPVVEHVDGVSESGNWSDRNVSPMGRPSVISEGMWFKGEVNCSGSLNLEGRIEGKLDAPQVSIGATGSFSGDLKATSVSLSGEVEGTLTCDDLTLSHTGRIKGEVVCKTLKVHPGAILEGDLRMQS